MVVYNVGVMVRQRRETITGREDRARCGEARQRRAGDETLGPRSWSGSGNVLNGTGRMEEAVRDREEGEQAEVRE
jgi:hypothetical protein